MSKIGNMTVRVQQSRSGQTVDVSTTGKRGSVPLNTITLHLVEPSQSPSVTASAFWTDVLTKVLAAL
jgi:hypothetical protein